VSGRGRANEFAATTTRSPPARTPVPGASATRVAGCLPPAEVQFAGPGVSSTRGRAVHAVEAPHGRAGGRGGACGFPSGGHSAGRANEFAATTTRSPPARTPVPGASATRVAGCVPPRRFSSPAPECRRRAAGLFTRLKPRTDAPAAGAGLVAFPAAGLPAQDGGRRYAGIPRGRANEFAATTTRSPPARTPVPGRVPRAWRGAGAYDFPSGGFTRSGRGPAVCRHSAAACRRPFARSRLHLRPAGHPAPCVALSPGTGVHAGGLRVVVAANSFALPAGCPHSS
jgi:hypothetical protein